jgi:hypothetical protein
VTHGDRHGWDRGDGIGTSETDTPETDTPETGTPEIGTPEIGR